MAEQSRPARPFITLLLSPSQARRHYIRLRVANIPRSVRDLAMPGRLVPKLWTFSTGQRGSAIRNAIFAGPSCCRVRVGWRQRPLLVSPNFAGFPADWLMRARTGGPGAEFPTPHAGTGPAGAGAPNCQHAGNLGPGDRPSRPPDRHVLPALLGGCPPNFPAGRKRGGLAPRQDRLL